MKSAYELAMERLNKTAPAPTLTTAQKDQIAELDSLYKSKIAERETFLNSLIAKATAKADRAEVQELQAQLGRDLQTIREEWDTKKSKVWEKEKLK